MKTRIGLTLRESNSPHEARDGISRDWIQYLESLSIQPILVTAAYQDPVGFLNDFDVKGLLLSNGSNVADDRDATTPVEGGDPLRDRMEHRLVEWAMKARLPILGVCRGAQLLNVHFGGLLHRAVGKGGLNHAGTTHSVEICDPTFVERLGCSTLTVNSYHQQGMTEAMLGKELKAFARSSDGVVEGFFHPDRPLWGIQWHPERPSPSASVDRTLVEHWIRGGVL